MSKGKSSSNFLLPDQVYGEEIFSEMSEEEDTSFEVRDNYAQEMHKLLKSLEIWDDCDLLENHSFVNWPEKCQRFLTYHNIRPDFFCQYEKILSDFSEKKRQQKSTKRRRFDNSTTGKPKFSHDLDRKLLSKCNDNFGLETILIEILE